MKLRFTNILPLLLSLLACSSCVFDKFAECPGLREGQEQYVTLDLRINMNDGISPLSRADEGYGELGGYEPPLNTYEKVRTLRVVIVREDGTIEHNRMVTVKDGYTDGLIQSEDIIHDNLQFEIVANEKKKIYLFANESAVNNNKEVSEIFDFSSRLQIGEPFPTDDVAGILIKRNPAEAFIDNDADGAKTYVPMSESFEVTIPEFNKIPDQNGNINTSVAEKFITETLFITRSLIKFSFTVKLKDEGITKTQLALRGVKISNLANEGYYLPNSTEYNPAWDKPSTYDFGGREIVSFKVPYEGEAAVDETDLFSDCTFLFNENLPISSNLEESGSIMTYLPESKTIGDGKYMVKLLFSNDEDYYESKPLTIKYIPRNTHVKVNMVLNKSQLEATVAIVPYTSVVLDPLFGFEEINPGKKLEGQEENQPES